VKSLPATRSLSSPLLAALVLAAGALAACSSPNASGTATTTTTAGATTGTVTATTTTAAAAAAAAGPPAHETWLVVSSPAAPLLGELEDDDPPEEVIRKGEMVKITKELRQFHWDAKMDGKDDKRQGLAVEVKYAEEGARYYAFKPDLAGEASVPVTAWLCDEIAKKGPFDRARCPALLRRARTADGSILVFAACSSGTCPVAIVKDDKLSALPVENLTSGWFFSGKKRSVLLVATRWTKDEGKQSGGSLVPILVENGALARGEEIPVDTIDARDPKKSVARLVHATVTADGIALEGEESVKSADGKSLSTKPIHDKRPLPNLD
jgi:hypothetical protein